MKASLLNKVENIVAKEKLRIKSLFFFSKKISMQQNEEEIISKKYYILSSYLSLLYLPMHMICKFFQPMSLTWKSKKSAYIQQ